jgi:hypothetical protein
MWIRWSEVAGETAQARRLRLSKRCVRTLSRGVGRRPVGSSARTNDSGRVHPTRTVLVRSNTQFFRVWFRNTPKSRVIGGLLGS